jgi:acyl-CoA synthetase (AMP-forming)/AMP-acid ligase II
VVLFLRNNFFLPVVVHGVLMAGDIHVSVNPKSVARDLAFQHDNVEARFLMIEENYLGVVTEGVKIMKAKTVSTEISLSCTGPTTNQPVNSMNPRREEGTDSGSRSYHHKK